ncbi:uncharacterized protein LOC121581202 [Coregonus clupeaformis]|uniref:uncharacterized protein LOC121581202 n=1 Tax=Coregonus clupeaformis TaxID=59861 RepID=UPI001BE05CD2|nr:uncharacterized protein LOC121581202 [Coregonus clupeaformis]
MEESFETFEEELGRPEPPPQKPVRQVRRPVPEMYAQERRRTLQERTMSSQQEPPVMQQEVPKIMPREPSLPARSTSLRKAMSLQNLSQIETPWEGVTLNRCLFIAIAILLLSSGFQKLHETIKGRRAVAEEEYDDALTVRHSAMRYKVQPQEPETSLYEVLFWWLPDFNDEDDDGETKQGRLKKGVRERSLKGLRSRGTPEGRLVKGRKVEEKRAKRERDEETKQKKTGKQVKLRGEEK